MLPQTLLEYGADPNVVNIYGQVALHYCWDKWNEMVKRVAYPGATERLELLDKLRVIVAELLRHGADPNVEDLAQKRPLHRAASHGQVFIVIDLLTVSCVFGWVWFRCMCREECRASFRD